MNSKANGRKLEEVIISHSDILNERLRAMAVNKKN